MKRRTIRRVRRDKVPFLSGCESRPATVVCGRLPQMQAFSASLPCAQCSPVCCYRREAPWCTSVGTLVHVRINTDLLSGERNFVGWFGTRGQVLSCVRPHQLRHITRRGPVWRYAGRVQNRSSVLESTRQLAGFPDPVSLTVCPYHPPTCSHSRQSNPASLYSGGDGRRAVLFVVRHERPGDARRAVGQRHRDQHARLASQHSGQPGVLRTAPPSRPSPSRRRPAAASDRAGPSWISCRASASRRSSAAGEPSPARPRSPGRAGSSPSAARRPESPLRSAVRFPGCSSAVPPVRLRGRAHGAHAPAPRSARRGRRFDRATAPPARGPGPAAQSRRLRWLPPAARHRPVPAERQRRAPPSAPAAR